MVSMCFDVGFVYFSVVFSNCLGFYGFPVFLGSHKVFVSFSKVS